VGCASDRPSDETPDPTPAARADRTTSAPLSPSPSAVQAAVLVWGRAQAAGGDGLRLRRLESRTVLGQDDQPDRIHVKLDLLVFGTDAIQTTGRYVSLLDELSTSTWCENVKRASTRVLASGEALEVVGLEVLVQPPDSSWSGGAEREDPELLANGIASEMDLGVLESRTTTRRPTRRVTVASHHLRPADRRRVYELETILAFATRLEERTVNLSVTGVELRNVGPSRGLESSDEWIFKLVLTSRSEQE
jgi:hypothetical protein